MQMSFRAQKLIKSTEESFRVKMGEDPGLYLSLWFIAQELIPEISTETILEIIFLPDEMRRLL